MTILFLRHYLRHVHVPGLAVFGLVFATYAIATFWLLLNGFVREVTGHHNPGQPSRFHKLLFQLHTGHKISLQNTYGDEKRLKRIAGDTRRATPDGMAVYYHPWKRWQRAVRNNFLIVVWLSSIGGMIVDSRDTVQALTFFLYFGGVFLLACWVRRKRRIISASRPIGRPAMSMTKLAKGVFRDSRTTVDDKPTLVGSVVPRLTSEVPTPIIARLLADQMGCSTAEAMARLRLDPDRGQIELPDSFAALASTRERIEEVIRAHTEGKVSFSWHTTTNPRVLTWLPILSGLPRIARFRDYLKEIEACKPGEFAVGVREDKTVYVASHNGEMPWHCTAAASGTGKSTRFLVKAAQIAHRFPKDELYCVDTKQISFEYLHGIPGIHVFDNPQSQMREIWNVFYRLEGILRDRYAAVREKRNRPEDFHDIWLLVDEGNDLAANLKSYWTRKLRKSGEQARPVIWGEAIATLLRLGRQAGIRGEFMLQDITDSALGGESLKSAFSVFGMAEWKVAQWNRIIGPPAPPMMTGPGKILMVHGNNQTWVQGFYDDPQWLRDYALAGRKEGEHERQHAG